MSNFKKLSAYADVPCTWVREVIPDDDKVKQLKAENAKLRDLAKYAILCSEGDVRCEACPYHDKTGEPHIICTMRKAAYELGVEIPA